MRETHVYVNANLRCESNWKSSFAHTRIGSLLHVISRGLYNNISRETGLILCK
jgi:hypothetical protein